MLTSQLGIIGFFGILVPGTYLLGMLILGAIFITGDFGWENLELVQNIATKHSVTTTSVFLLASYLVGVVLRLVGPNKIDKLATWYLLMVNIRKKSPSNWISDVFPYEKSMEKTLNEGGMKSIVEFLNKCNSKYGNPDNTPFFNYCKLLVRANSAELGRLVNQSEAMVRFLSGTAMALIVSIGMWASLFVLFTVVDSSLANVSLVFLFLSIVLLLPILRRFKHQRRREVQLVWFSLYQLCHGYVPLPEGVQLEKLETAVNMDIDAPNGVELPLNNELQKTSADTGR